MDEQTGILQDFVPFGATALFPFDFNKHHQLKQGKGTDDHILPVGDWLSPFLSHSLEEGKPLRAISFVSNETVS